MTRRGSLAELDDRITSPQLRFADPLAGDWAEIMAKRDKENPPEHEHPEEHEIGRISHYSIERMVATVELNRGSLAVGDTIHVHGYANQFSTDFSQTVKSLQREGQPIQEATTGQVVEIQLEDHASVHDHIYKFD